MLWHKPSSRIVKSEKVIWTLTFPQILHILWYITCWMKDGISSTWHTFVQGIHCSRCKNVRAASSGTISPASLDTLKSLEPSPNLGAQFVNLDMEVNSPFSWSTPSTHWTHAVSATVQDWFFHRAVPHQLRSCALCSSVAFARGFSCSNASTTAFQPPILCDVY